MGWIRSLRAGVGALQNKRMRNAEIEEELQSHLEESTNEKMRRGINAADAVRQARAEVRSTETIKHRVWNAGWEEGAERLWNAAGNYIWVARYRPCMCRALQSSGVPLVNGRRR